MHKFLNLMAVLEFLGGLSVFLSARSAIHEILATLMLGFAILTFALAAILKELRATRPEPAPAPAATEGRAFAENARGRTKKGWAPYL
ncbi:hypothetical protein [Afifella sp. YEN Y35]|uniref:hypothetical protein n=1 Tax=Afifella sp. YEN Y35 TaxID=3388337 RepID=UPI0039E1CDC8